MNIEHIYAEEVAAMNIDQRKAGASLYQIWNEIYVLSIGINQITVELNNIIIRKLKFVQNIGYIIIVFGFLHYIGNPNYIFLDIIVGIIGYNFSNIFSLYCAKKGIDEYFIESLENGTIKEKGSTTQESQTGYDDFAYAGNENTGGGFGFDSSRFSSDAKRQQYEQAHQTMNDPHKSTKDRALALKFIAEADQGNISGIKGLPPPTSPNA